MRRRIIPFFVPHLGCPNDCVFCNQRHISGNISAPAPEDVCRGISAALEKTGPGAQVAFYGGSFTAVEPELQRSLLMAVRPFIERGEVSGIRVSTRPDCIDTACLEMLKSAGVDTVELGAQSLDDEVLLLSARGHTAHHVEMASKLVKKMGFTLILQMMTGLPGDSPEKNLETARRIAKLKPDGVRIYPTVIVKDTALETMWREGKYEPHSVQDAVLWCAPIVRLFEKEHIPISALALTPQMIFHRERLWPAHITRPLVSL
ncbi:MAG: radical SAM protein [Oscillospiraceae bacterium]|nr:radical SAM protein [Oscillospiraceae bacterium]